MSYRLEKDKKIDSRPILKVESIILDNEHSVGVKNC
jgi:hypothetical protein